MTPELAARVAAAAALLREGGLVAYPTETYYGLGALAADAAAIARLARAKGRPDGQPLPLVAADLEQVRSVAEVGPLAAALAGRFWPGPLTLVLPARAGLPAAVTGGGATVGIRIPGGELARELARLAGGPIVSTSANPSGGPPPTRAAALDPALAARLDLVLDGGDTPGGAPSTVVAVEGRALRLVRAGAVPFELLDALRRAAAPI